MNRICPKSIALVAAAVALALALGLREAAAQTVPRLAVSKGWICREDLERIESLSRVVAEGSLCGLGKSAMPGLRGRGEGESCLSEPSKRLGAIGRGHRLVGRHRPARSPAGCPVVTRPAPSDYRPT